MATTIRVSCPTCGKQDLSPGDILLTIEHKSYYFECPACEEVVIKAADRKIASLLISAGVGTEEEDSGIGKEFETPPDPKEPHPEGIPKHAAPITHDDLIDFHEKFDEALEELFRSES